LVRFLAFQCVFANQGWRRRNRHNALKTKALRHENGGLSAIPKVLYILPAVEPYQERRSRSTPPFTRKPPANA
jgi:hypothetical protein